MTLAADDTRLFHFPFVEAGSMLVGQHHLQLQGFGSHGVELHGVAHTLLRAILVGTLYRFPLSVAGRVDGVFSSLERE